MSGSGEKDATPPPPPLQPTLEVEPPPHQRVPLTGAPRPLPGADPSKEVETPPPPPLQPTRAGAGRGPLEGGEEVVLHVEPPHPLVHPQPPQRRQPQRPVARGGGAPAGGHCTANSGRGGGAGRQQAVIVRQIAAQALLGPGSSASGDASRGGAAGRAGDPPMNCRHCRWAAFHGTGRGPTPAASRAVVDIAASLRSGLGWAAPPSDSDGVLGAGGLRVRVSSPAKTGSWPTAANTD